MARIHLHAPNVLQALDLENFYHAPNSARNSMALVLGDTLTKSKNK